MTTLLLYGADDPAARSGWTTFDGNGLASPSLVGLLRRAEEHDRRAFERAYLLTDDGKVLTARVLYTFDGCERRIEFVPFYAEQMANQFTISWSTDQSETTPAG